MNFIIAIYDDVVAIVTCPSDVTVQGARNAIAGELERRHIKVSDRGVIPEAVRVICELPLLLA